MGYFLEVTKQLWLNSEEAPHDWVKQMEINDSIIVDENIQNDVAQKNKCLGVIIRKEGCSIRISAKITSWDCNTKNSFVCSIEDSQFNRPSQLQKFPCIKQNNEVRPKRASDEETDKGNK